MHFRNDLFFSDVGNSRIRKVDTSSGFISTVAGGGTEGLGDGGLATNATFSSHPMRIAMDFNGNLFVADAHQNRIRRVDISTRFISTVAGNGIAGYSGDGGLATQASINSPHGVAVDRTGNVFVADLGNSRIRRVDSKTGIITTFAGNGNKGFSGDQEPAVTASLFSPISVEVDSNDNIHIVDHGNNRIRKVDAATGIITTVAGNGTEGFSGDGGPASEAEMSRPRDVVVDLEGGVFFADQVNNRVRKVDAATRIITTVAGSGVDGTGVEHEASSPVDSHQQDLPSSDRAGWVERRKSRAGQGQSMVVENG